MFENGWKRIIFKRENQYKNKKSSMIQWKEKYLWKEETNKQALKKLDNDISYMLNDETCICRVALYSYPIYNNVRQFFVILN